MRAIPMCVCSYRGFLFGVCFPCVYLFVFKMYVRVIMRVRTLCAFLGLVTSGPDNVSVHQGRGTTSARRRLKGLFLGVTAVKLLAASRSKRYRLTDFSKLSPAELTSLEATARAIDTSSSQRTFADALVCVGVAELPSVPAWSFVAAGDNAARTVRSHVLALTNRLHECETRCLKLEQDGESMLRSACQLREQLAQAQLDSELRPQYERLIERIQAQLEDSVPKAQHEAIANDLAAMQETERERRVLDRLFEEQTETLGRLKGDYDSACQALHAAAAERDALSDANSQLGRQVSALEAKLSSQESDLQGAIASALQHCAALRAAEHDNQRVLDALQAMDSFSGVGNPVKQQMVVSGLTPSPSSHQRLANALFDGFTKALCN
eukprot:m.228282 g.228282  ORF g.228282 m.228282 type:complete len:381 (+) comp18827_c0_seq9:2370-3512(+)